MFEKHDRSGRGKLSLAELLKALQALGYAFVAIACVDIYPNKCLAKALKTITQLMVLHDVRQNCTHVHFGPCKNVHQAQMSGDPPPFLDRAMAANCTMKRRSRLQQCPGTGVGPSGILRNLVLFAQLRPILTQFAHSSAGLEKGARDGGGGG